MNIQIFGTNKSFDTKKAQRWFKERGIRFQMIDMKEKGMSRGEFDNVCRAVGGWAKLVDENAKDQGHAGAFEMARREPAGRQAVREPAALPPAHCAQRQTGHRRLLPRSVGEVGVRQTTHLSLQEPRGPTDLRTRP